MYLLIKMSCISVDWAECGIQHYFQKCLVINVVTNNIESIKLITMYLNLQHIYLSTCYSNNTTLVM